MSPCWESGVLGLQAKLEKEGGPWPLTPVSCPNPRGSWRMGLGGVGDLPKTSPLVTQLPVVGLSLWGDRVGLAVLANRVTSGQVWCPSSPGVPASQPLLVLTPGSLEYHPPKLQGLRLLAAGFRALVLSHLGKWQGPPGNDQGHLSGSSRGSLVLGFGPLCRLRGVGVSASSHVSPVIASSCWA